MGIKSVRYKARGFDVVWVVLIIAVYLILNSWVLPKLGVPT